MRTMKISDVISHSTRKKIITEEEEEEEEEEETEEEETEEHVNLKKTMISLCIIWDTNMVNPKKLSRLVMIDRITKRQIDITNHRDKLENAQLLNYSRMVGTRPLSVLLMTKIIRYAWEMDTMTGTGYKYRVFEPFNENVLVGRYKWALSLGLVCKQFFNLVKSSLFKRLCIYNSSLTKQWSRYEDNKVRALANDVSQHIDNIACVIKQPTNLTIQCKMLIGIALKPSIGAVILLQGITKLRLVDTTSNFYNLFDSVLQVMVNLESLTLDNTGDLSEIYRPSLKHLSIKGCHPLFTQKYTKFEQHDLTLAGLSNYKATGQRFKTNYSYRGPELYVKTLYSYIAHLTTNE
ncbi:hypothetical protein DFA_02124 [Cavenderia fasciculata]|uniref:Uncharacterized protein n=1 Tax=Cavenderia fasciculata TaxID=261658 RepID=F4PYS1_CACFS|nr:uncharacterized protein DFA_02124 [Cavenderia fasciculata]EGG19337.1 hypothetical protein DFA_02124 [Cavenderia fasciculata]|eukprot:XP_004357608.1 hypothetical protein DFA_02124 [Cavenderia fasciculata]